MGRYVRRDLLICVSLLIAVQCSIPSGERSCMMSQWVNLLHGHYPLPVLGLVYLVLGSRVRIGLFIVCWCKKIVRTTDGELCKCPRLGMMPQVQVSPNVLYKDATLVSIETYSYFLPRPNYSVCACYTLPTRTQPLVDISHRLSAKATVKSLKCTKIQKSGTKQMER